MNADGNIVMKKLLQKISDYVLKTKGFEEFDKVDVFFAFGSRHKTAMCDWVYGIKIKTDEPYSTRDLRVRDFQLAVRKITDQKFNQTVCCTDVIFDKD